MKRWLMHPMNIGKLLIFGTFLVLAATASAAAAEEPVLNIYTARHYQSDDEIYAAFTKATGIAVNRIEDKEDALIERIKNEGANSPADLFITADAGRLWRAQDVGILQPVDSPVLNERIPASLRDPDGHWFGFSMRARVIYYSKAELGPDAVASYEDLADPKWRGKICIRSGSNVYNLSLLGSLIELKGEAEAEIWAKGVAANLAREPQGGDTDQIKAVAAGECQLAVANTYYYVRLMKSDDPADREVAEKVGVIFPNQGDRGTHVNISGAGVTTHAKNRAEAIRFLEWLATPDIQARFASANFEFPANPAAKTEPVVAAWGPFKQALINVGRVGETQPAAVRLMDRAGWR